MISEQNGEMILVIITEEWTRNILLEFEFQVFESICMCIFFFYRLFVLLGSHLLFITHHIRSGLPLGLQLLKGRSTSRMPEDASLPVPKDNTISAWENSYAPILHRGHLRVRGPGVPCLRLVGTDRRDVLEACLGCYHMSESVGDIHRW